MLRSYKTEIDPTPEQITKINKTIGVCRFAYNFYISHNNSLYENGEGFINAYDFIKWMNHEFLPANPEYMWIKEVYTVSVKRSIMNADKAFERFFRKKSRYPKFKKKRDSDVKMYFYKNNKNDCRCERHKLSIPTLGWVRLKEKGYLPTTKTGVTIKSGTVSCRAGRYYVSVLVDLPETEVSEPFTDGVGLHMGIKNLAVLSNGDTYENINKTKRIRKLEKRLARAQRSLSRKYTAAKQAGVDDGRNIEKQLLKIQRIYQRMSNIRNDHVNKVVCEIVKTKPSYITIGDLSVRKLTKNRLFSKAVTDQGLYSFREKLQAKCSAKGIELRIADQAYPSARRCSCCGAVKDKLDTRERLFKCSCGYSGDRAMNASLNLRDAVDYTVA